MSTNTETEDSKPKSMKERVEEAAKDAQDAFWSKIVEHFPEATSGDMDPLDVFKFGNACEKVIETWVNYNVLDDEEDPDHSPN